MYKNRNYIIQEARTLQASQPVFLDTETTGLGSQAEIVEIAILDHQGQALVNTLVRPLSSIPYEVVRIHGIDDRMVKNAPTWVEVWPQIEAALRGRRVGVYNADFDLRMLHQSNRLNGVAWQQTQAHFFCIMKMYMAYSGLQRFQKLEVAGRLEGISLPNAHRAHADTLLAREVFMRMANSGV